MIFKPFTRGQGPVILENWSRIRSRLMESLRDKNCNNKRMKESSGIGSQNLQNLL